MAVKMNKKIITKNHVTGLEIAFLTKSISEPNGCITAMPTAWELKKNKSSCINYIRYKTQVLKNSYVDNH